MRLAPCLLALPLLVAILPVPPAALLAAAPPAAAAANTFTFQRLDRTYQDVVPELLPYESDSLTIRLSSPRNAITLRRHSVHLEPGLGGSQSAELTVQFQGSGHLVADVDLAGFTSRLEDDITVPLQSQTLEGRARVTRTQGGYVVTPEQLPRRLTVRIESRLGAQLVSLCDRLTLLPGTGLTCDGLERAFSTAVVPLPPAGETFLLADEDLTPQERAALDRYLASASPAR